MSSFLSPSQLTAERRDVGHRTVIAVSGEVDMASSPSLRSELEAALDAQELCVDLCDTTFMDSSGIHVLLDIHRLAEGRMTIVCSPGPVRRVLDLTGVVSALRVSNA